MLSMSESGVYKLVRRGDVPYKRIGKSIRFDHKEIEDWVEQRSYMPDVDVESQVDAMIADLAIR